MSTETLDGFAIITQAKTAPPAVSNGAREATRATPVIFRIKEFV
jgi:hypothetical protein